MTGDEIIDKARVDFGEKSASSLTSDDMKGLLNKAIQELYTWLPPTENTQSIDTSSVSLTNGAGEIPETWDKVLEVSDNTGPLTSVDQPTITNIDRLGDYFSPETPVWYFDGERIFVRPVVSSVTVTFTSPPSKITNFTAEVSQIPLNYHTALVHLVASLAYAQEEDIEQAEHYRGAASAQVASRLPQEGAA